MTAKDLVLSKVGLFENELESFDIKKSELQNFLDDFKNISKIEFYSDSLSEEEIKDEFENFQIEEYYLFLQKDKLDYLKYYYYKNYFFGILKSSIYMIIYSKKYINYDTSKNEYKVYLTHSNDYLLGLLTAFEILDKFKEFQEKLKNGGYQKTLKL